MAQQEGAQADNPSINKKPATEHVWDIKLFQNVAFASSFACIICGHPPKQCWMNEKRETLCGQCSIPFRQNGDKIEHNPFADDILDKAEIACKNVLFDPSKKDDEKKEEPKQCEWKGTIKDWGPKHDAVDLSTYYY